MHWGILNRLEMGRDVFLPALVSEAGHTHGRQRRISHYLLLLVSVAAAARTGAASPATEKIGDVHSALAAGTWAEPDEYSWLEERKGAEALAWVGKQNERTNHDWAGDAHFKALYDAALAVDGIRDVSAPSRHYWRGWVYAVSYDATHPQGLLRRTKMEDFLANAPMWELVLDIGSLPPEPENGRKFALGQIVFCPESDRRCLLQLTTRYWGHQAYREFDVESRTFPEDGFSVPEQLAVSAEWKNKDTLWIAADSGPGSLNPTATGEGSPLVVKEWSRGTPLIGSPTIYQGNPATAYKVGVQSLRGAEGANRVTIFETDSRGGVKQWLLDAGDKMTPLPTPTSVKVFGMYRGRLVFQTKDAAGPVTRNYPAGSILECPLAGPFDEEHVKPVDVPRDDREKFSQLIITNHGLLVGGSVNVTGRVWYLHEGRKGWEREAVLLPLNGTIDLYAFFYLRDEANDITFVTYEDYIEPARVFEIKTDAKAWVAESRLPGKAVRFNNKGLITEQFFAHSRDGTPIPYFVTRPQDFKYDGTAATMVYGYGAFGIGLAPKYDDAHEGRLWLEKGGVSVRACIRGGNEFGPKWAVKGIGRQSTYEDFEAVLEDLIARRITSREHLGLWGYSAGGLPIGVIVTHRPDLYHAAVLEAPVLDNFRPQLYNNTPEVEAHLFGSPAIPAERIFLERTSPFQNLNYRGDFPPLLILSTATDTNVQPGAPRRFAAKLEKLGMPFWYYEAADGGHSLGATSEQRAYAYALIYAYFARQLGL